MGRKAGGSRPNRPSALESVRSARLPVPIVRDLTSPSGDGNGVSNVTFARHRRAGVRRRRAGGDDELVAPGVPTEADVIFNGARSGTRTRGRSQRSPIGLSSRRAARVRARDWPRSSGRRRPDAVVDHETATSAASTGWQADDIGGAAGALTARRASSGRRGRGRDGRLSTPQRVPRLPEPARGEVSRRAEAAGGPYLCRHRRRHRVDAGLLALPRQSVHARAGRGQRDGGDRRTPGARRLRQPSGGCRAVSAAQRGGSISGASSNPSTATG